MQYINTTNLAIFNTLGDVRKSILPKAIPHIPTQDELKEVGIDYLYDYVPFESVLTYPVKGKPEYNKKYSRWEYSYTFKPKHTDATLLGEFVQSTLKERKDKTKERLDKVLSEKIDILTDKSPFAELISYDKQEAESRAYILDDESPIPYLSALAVSRGLNETVYDLAQKIIAKADVYASVHANILGEYQKLIKDLYSITADSTNIDTKLKEMDTISFAE
jgi:hypothetical protein